MATEGFAEDKYSNAGMSPMTLLSLKDKTHYSAVQHELHLVASRLADASRAESQLIIEGIRGRIR